MDQSSRISERTPLAPVAAVPPVPGPTLSLVTSRFRMAQPAEPAPDGWQDALAQLLGWLRIDAEWVAAARSRRLSRFADWGLAPDASAPVFSPWQGWSPVAFQHGGLGGLPDAQFVASYLIDHPRGAVPVRAGLDMVLMSPHPALCVADEAGSAPVPRAAALKAMIRLAREEGRERLAIILHARQRNAVAAQLLAAGKGLTRTGLEIEILTIEDALVPLIAGRTRWDAIIAMPDLRSTVFTLLGQTSGVRKAWPMLWFGGAGGDRLVQVTSEVQGEGQSRLAFDAPALIHGLALALHGGGAARAATRLHEAWARLRDSGVTTSGRGSDAPYAKQVSDPEFITMLCRDVAVSRRPQPGWHALKNAQTAISGSQMPELRVVL
ncbi:MAG: hypothetical protein EAY70_07995 [Sphingomonadales bacterium]|nr:MAG: hypothetical protein EAY70_07995 [Sphingomonadales bacterium]